MLFETFGGYDYVAFEEYGRNVYKFVCKDGTTIHVQFTEDPDTDGVYYRDYGTGELDCLVYDEIGTNDGVRILRTVTRTTIDFLEKVQPDKLLIIHVPTAAEAQEKLANKRFGGVVSNEPNKRAKVNRLFLEQELPSNYTYSIDKSVSKISKIQ